MKKSIRLTLAFLVCNLLLNAQTQRKEIGNLVIEGIDSIPQPIVEQMQRYQQTRSANLADWLPGNKGMIIATRFAETSQLHTVESPGAARRQITFFDEPVGGANISPNSEINGFLFAKDVGGNENNQIFFYQLATGSYHMITDGTSRNGSGIWDNEGKRFAFYSNKRNGTDWDIYISGVGKDDTPELVYQATGAWVPVDWSPDSRNLLLLNYISASESYFHILSLENQQLTPIKLSDEKTAIGGGIYSKDGKGLFIISNYQSEFNELQYVNLANNQVQKLTSNIHWNVEGLDLSDDGKKIAFTVNEGGTSSLYLFDVATTNYWKVENIPPGQIYGLNFHPTGKKLGLVINTSKTSGDIFTFDLVKKDLTQWTFSEVGGLNTEKFVLPQKIEYETFDSTHGAPRKIPAFYYQPTTEGKHPVMIYIHGGPEAQFAPAFISSFQYYINEMDIAIIAPNVRGSDGYGKSYLELDNGYLRENSVKDIGALIDWIEQQPELDASRVCVFGGSYGGYMVLASMIHFNDRLKCGIDVVGISNFVTFLENTQDYRRDLRRVEYGDERDPQMREFLLSISPTTHADKIKSPMLIVQGLNDPRVPASEAEQIVKAIRANNTDAWYILAKDEGHGFRKKTNSDYYQNAVVYFLQTFLIE